MSFRELIGECNLCGLCCYVQNPATGTFLKCEHLKVISQPGMPNATKCGIYEKRYNGMGIALASKDGQEWAHGMCAEGTPAAINHIVESGIGKGCSLALVEV